MYSEFLTYLNYGAIWYGRLFVWISLFFLSSKLCHRCEYENEDLTLHDRRWYCSACGETHDRDVNTSINPYIVGLGQPEVTSVEQALAKPQLCFVTFPDVYYPLVFMGSDLVKSNQME
jgi:putative transposase